MKKGKNFKGKKQMKLSEKRKFSKGKEVVCFERKKLGHIKLECPLLKKKKEKAEKKKRALKAET